MVKSYEQLRGHQADFIVRYRLYAPVEGGREVTFQHLRCDFCYEGNNPKDGIFMIHPEFLDEQSQPWGEELPVPLEGRASMWIVISEMRPTHQARIQIGTRAHFMEGSRKIGDVTVEAIVGLFENPVSN